MTISRFGSLQGSIEEESKFDPPPDYGSESEDYEREILNDSMQQEI